MQKSAGKAGEYTITGLTQDESFITTSLEPLLTRVTISNEVGECVGMVYENFKMDDENLEKFVSQVAENVYAYVENCNS